MVTAAVWWGAGDFLWEVGVFFWRRVERGTDCTPDEKYFLYWVDMAGLFAIILFAGGTYIRCRCFCSVQRLDGERGVLRRMQDRAGCKPFRYCLQATGGRPLRRHYAPGKIRDCLAQGSARTEKQTTTPRPVKTAHENDVGVGNAGRYSRYHLPSAPFSARRS